MTMQYRDKLNQNSFVKDEYTNKREQKKEKNFIDCIGDLEKINDSKFSQTKNQLPIKSNDESKKKRIIISLQLIVIIIVKIPKVKIQTYNGRNIIK